MAINFSINDVVRVNTSYVNNSLINILPAGNPTLSILGYLGFQPSVVKNFGAIFSQSTLFSFIQVVPLNTSSPVYNNGLGAIVYFPSDTTLNNSFELSSAFLPTSVAVECLNLSGSSILKGQAVCLTGYDVSQKPTVALANAVSTTFYGIADEDIPDTGSGDVITQGSFQGLDTTSFVVAGTVFLSNTPGAIANSAGTTSVVIGRALNVALNGAISIGLLDNGGGGGGSSTTPFTTVSGDVTLTPADGPVIFLVNGTNKTITLPLAAAYSLKFYYFKDQGGAFTGPRTIVPQGGETIDNGPSTTINTDYGARTLYSDGTSWWIMD